MENETLPAVNEKTGHYPLRLPASLSDRIRAAAAAERRSINSQIIVLLEQALPAETTAPDRPTRGGQSA
ncbi:Arc family DNA-binding protein [Devosia sp. ZB163]|uniref:Arc family DNA-binding protein n=1 Tax=Devosia sp. ZB163 TaxID=3025938 RepID=UPI003FCDD3B6